ncbi:MAG TPA: arylamine N-acetyltransferase [Candidatus Limnocylindrales bacterium]
MIDDYLALLGVRRVAPSVAHLFELHRAHVERVPYSNAQIMRGKPASIQQRDAVRQILDGHGGYCFHLNGAFSWLLRELGFAITLHRGYVFRHGATDADLNHLVLLAHDLDGTVWFVDAGLGDALHEPLPLAPGHYRQGPFVYSLESTGSRWRFTHDERGSFAAMEFEPAAAVIDDFAEAHKFLSTSPESSFTRFLTAQIRLPDRVRLVRGCTRVELDAAGKHEETLASQVEWADAYARLGLSNVDDLWEHTRAAHERWLASL